MLELKPDGAMAAFRARAATANRQRAGVIADAFLTMSNGTLSEDERAAARAAAHTIAGSAGTFGFSEASRLARELEDLWDELGDDAVLGRAGIRDGANVRYGLVHRGLERLDRLRQALDEQPVSAHDPHPARDGRARP